VAGGLVNIVEFDQELEDFSLVNADAWFPICRTQLTGFARRTLLPNLFARRDSTLLNAVRFSKLASTVTIGLGRVQYVGEIASENLIFGANGLPVAAFNIPVPWTAPMFRASRRLALRRLNPALYARRRRFTRRTIVGDPHVLQEFALALRAR